jgi:hypothetical protein
MFKYYYILILGCCLLAVRAQEQRQTITLLNNVKIAFTYRQNQLDVLITTPLGNKVSVNNAWLGIGFNTESRMV